MFHKFTAETRLYIYGIVTAAIPLLISLGALTEGIAQQVSLVIAAILGVTAPRLASANVNTHPETAAPAAEPTVIETIGYTPEGAVVLEK
jgi:hypothetical protein